MLGAMLREQNKLAEAREVLEKAAQLAPDNPAVFEQLDELEMARKNYPARHRRVDECIEKHPDAAAGYYMRGKLYLGEGNFDLAQTALLKAIDLDPNLTKAYELLIPTYTRTNKLPEALNQMNAVLAKQPNDVRALLVAGLIYDAMKDYNK